MLLFFPLGLALLYVLTFTLPAQAQAPVAVTVEFEESTYTVAESDDAETAGVTENEVEVKVTLSADPEREVIIPITKTNEGGASNSDYSGVPASVTFASGETEQTFTFTATSDTADDDEDKVKLSFGTLPTGVTAGTTAETTVSITDDDYPNITVSFGASTYSVDEGGDSVAVVVKLSASPERDFLRIPFTAMLQGGALAADYEFRDGVNVNQNDTEVEIRFTAIQDTDEDHGESILLGFGTPLPERVTASGTTTTTVTIIDDDPAVTVEFRAATYEVAEGGTVLVTVGLSETPHRPLVIPVTYTNQGGAVDIADHNARNVDVSIVATATGNSISFEIFQDTIADHGESLLMSFGTDLPPGVTVGTNATATVTIIDDDPAVTVKFDSTTYSVTEGNSVDVTVTLSADPQRPVTIPVTATGQGGATSTDDYTDPTSVTFISGETSKTLSFSVTEDTIADHGESVRLAFGSDLPPGVTRASSNRTTTVTIIDDDPAVTVNFAEATLDVIEGETAKVFLTLTLTPQRPFTIQVTVTNQGGAGSEDHHAPATYNIEFDANDPAKRINIQVSQDTLVERGEGVKLAIVSDLPPGVSLGAVGEQTVNFIDDDPAVTVTFGAATYSADEGDSVDVTVTLSADPQRSVTIPITGTGESGGTSADFSIPEDVTFNSGDTSQIISFTAVDDDIDDDDEKIKLAFGTFPAGVTAGTTPTTKVSINDDDDPQVKVQFGSATYSITEPGSVTVKLTLDADPEREVVIPLSAAYGNDATSADFSGVAGSVTFDSGETSKTFSVSTGDDFIDRNGRSATISFGTLPARVTEGDVDETVISITDSDVRGVNVFPTTLTIAEDGTGTYTLNLTTEPTAPVTITINDPTDNTEAKAEPASYTFDASNFGSPKMVEISVTDDDEDEESETSTVTHTVSGGDYGAKGVTAANVVVTITDDDETPVISGSAATNFREIEYDAEAADVDLEIATYSATDGDGDDIMWSLSGTDASFFEFAEESDGDLVLSFDGGAFAGKEGPDFENPDDDGSNNTYEVTVEASDGTNTGTRNVTVTVTQLDERPRVRPLYQGQPNVLGGRELAESSYDVVPAEVRSVGTFRGQDEEGAEPHLGPQRC